MAYDRCFIHQSTSPRNRSARRQPRHGPHKRGLNSKINLAIESLGLPVEVTVTSGTVADSSQVKELISEIEAQKLLADRGYDTNEVIEYLQSRGMEVVIPPKSNRRDQREFDKVVYENRYKIENTFLKLKEWRGIASRYAKTTKSYIAAVQIRCMYLWLQVI